MNRLPETELLAQHAKAGVSLVYSWVAQYWMVLLAGPRPGIQHCFVLYRGTKEDCIYWIRTTL